VYLQTSFELKRRWFREIPPGCSRGGKEMAAPRKEVQSIYFSSYFSDFQFAHLALNRLWKRRFLKARIK
jgi:hypothetical protein